MASNDDPQSSQEKRESAWKEIDALHEALTLARGQHQQAVDQIKRAHEDWRNLAAIAEIPVLFLDLQLNVRQFTPAMMSWMDLQPTDIGKPLTSIPTHVHDGKKLVDCQNVLRDHKVREREVRTGDGRVCVRRISPYKSSDDRVTGLVIDFQDITQQRKAVAEQHDKDAHHLAEMHESAERIQSILNTAADAILTVDFDGIIESVNRATESMFRCKRRDLLGKNLSSLLPALVEALPGEAEADVAVSAVLTRLVGHRQESVANRKDGTKFPVDIAMSRVDHLQLYTAILRDLTVRKQLQAHILEIATEEQTRIGQELHDGTQQELAGLALFAGAIHECLENATCQSHPATDPEYCLVQRAELQRAKELLAKLQQGLQQSSLNVQTLAHGILPVQVDARGLNAALTELAASANHPGKIDCQFEFLGTGTITNNAVATQLYRIAQESLHNSLKHGRADKIRISLFQSANQVLLEIRDNGTGIDLGAMPRSSGKRQGFGLRIMSYRASILGGELQVLRNEGRGTTVRCSIPTLERIP